MKPLLMNDVRATRRWSRTSAGAAGLIVGCGLLAVRPLLAQTAATAIAPSSAAQWLALLANTISVTEGLAFIFGAYQFWMGRRERNAADVEAAKRAIIDSNYQAWQVINSAQGKGGSGGRIEGLAALLRNGVSLAGICLDDAWLEGIELPKATLTRASLQRTNFARANLAEAYLEGANFRGADLLAANLAGASLNKADLTGARLSAANLDGADLNDVIGWAEIASISHASIEGVRRPPEGFVAWARKNGAVDSGAPAVPEDARPAESREFRAL
jgi:hypothetical protein